MRVHNSDDWVRQLRLEDFQHSITFHLVDSRITIIRRSVLYLDDTSQISYNSTLETFS